jgi:hypothetical protein
MGRDWILFSESVNKTKVARRKKMTSMRGIISMRAFLAPSPGEEGAPDMVGEVWPSGG